VDTTKEKKFKKLLNNQYNWPTNYLFKFIVTNKFKDKLLSVLGEPKIIEKPSSKGNYISISLRMWTNSAEDIIKIYKKASKVETVILL
jgi:putative lipoic acid-binding regulatory protein